MQAGDHLFGTYRSHGIYIAKGGDLRRMWAELYGKDTGCARGKGGSMHLLDVESGLVGCSAIVASTIPVAVGDALAAKILGEQRVAVAFFGDGALGEGVTYESLNFAALKKLPIVFVVENNDLAVHSRVRDRHASAELYRFGEPLGVPGTRLDGMDVFAVHRAMTTVLDEVRAGSGPRLLELVTYRSMEHVGPGSDADLPYRHSGSTDLRGRDPLHLARETLRQRYAVSEARFLEWEAEFRAEIDAAVAFAESSPFPAVEELYVGVFRSSPGSADRA
jgi:TPP-dependent pyruvate/acetoin dehydrogenase alpha subunit